MSSKPRRANAPRKPVAADAAEAVRAAEAALADGRIEDAVSVAGHALAGGAEHPLLLNLAAFDDERSGRLSAALDKLHRALDIAPADASILAAIGHCLVKMGRADEALIAFDSALALAPGAALAHNGRGLALETLGDLHAAEAAQRQAADLDPAFSAPRGALAALAVRAGRDDEARGHAAGALALEPDQEAATLALATLDFRAGDAAAAERGIAGLIARRTLAPLQHAAAQRLRADALDAQGRFDEAFHAYDEANARLASTYAARFADPDVEDGVSFCTRLSGYFEGQPSARWGPAPGNAGSATRRHVFLVGFPRSGTTLLEQVLASHPQVVALEERPTLAEAGGYFQDTPSLDRLAELPQGEADALRADYWARVSGFGVDPAGKVFVDKLPLNTLWAPYIAKLFPDARILFAQRDPRDVVLSCFRRRFVVNALTYHFTNIDSLARFYGSVMQLAETYRARLPLAWYVHRHERLVDAFDEETHDLCDFLGLRWTKGLQKFAETARRRDVRTPSAPQVRRGLYREGMGQWRAYAQGMPNALAILQPWVDRFGYEA